MEMYVASILLKCHSGCVTSQRLMTTDLRGAWKTPWKIYKSNFSHTSMNFAYVPLEIISVYALIQMFSSSNIYLLNSTSTLSIRLPALSEAYSILVPSISIHSNICPTLTVLTHLEHNIMYQWIKDSNEY